MSHHPRRDEIATFHAARLASDVELDPSTRTCVVTSAEQDPFEVQVFEAPQVTMLTVHPSPRRAIDRMLDALDPRERATAEALVRRAETRVARRGGQDVFLYLDARRARLPDAAGIRALTPADAETLRELQRALEPRERSYVEVGHPGGHGAFRDDALESAASLLIETSHPIADVGVVTHPARRRRGLGKAAAGASIRWALEKDLVCQWVTTDRNTASLALARSLGFARYATETVLRCT